MTDRVGALVVGAGVIGLAVAWQLAEAGQDVLLVECADAIGLATSSRNSEVIHAGLYNPPGSLKSTLCVRGRELLYDFCKFSGVEAQALGKLVVATSDAEAETLHRIKTGAEANGVQNLQWLDGAQAKRLEPELSCTAAFLSPSTGILDSRAYMLALRAAGEARGVTLALRTSFIGGQYKSGHFLAELESEDGISFALECENLVNCAGHGAHRIAASLAGYDPQHLPPRFLAKGSYCSVSGKSPFTRLIYPVPVPGALGIHVTVDFNGQARLGPDITWVDDLDYTVDQSIGSRFAKACSKYWPGISARELTPSYCGIRPKLHGPEQKFADFLIQGREQHGLPGLVNLFGIESPGLTSSLAIAEHVKGKLLA